jgi:hypothetical protein
MSACCPAASLPFSPAFHDDDSICLFVQVKGEISPRVIYRAFDMLSTPDSLGGLDSSGICHRKSNAVVVGCPVNFFKIEGGLVREGVEVAIVDLKTDSQSKICPNEII